MSINRQERLRALADQIDHEQLWRRPAMDRDSMTDEQRARLDAGVQLRRYAEILEPGRWLIITPSGPMQFSAGTLDGAYAMAKRHETRKALAAIAAK